MPMSQIDFKSLYSQAVITMCWVVTCHENPRKTKKSPFRQLVFASVELIPNYMNLSQIASTPAKDAEQTDKFAGIRIFFIRLVVSSAKGVDWYEKAVKEGHVTMFWDKEKPVWLGPYGKDIRLVSYPRYPETAFLSDSPIISKCWGHAQVSHFMPIDPLDDLIGFISHQNVADWIDERLCWRLEENIEFLGSICLIAPNPYYFRSNCSLKHDLSGKNSDSIEFRVDRFSNDFAKQLKVVLAERFNGNELGNIQHRYLEDSQPLVFSLPGRACETGYVVFDNHGTIWDMQNFAPFIRSISLEMGVIDKNLIFTCKDGEKQSIAKLGEVREISIEVPEDSTKSIALSQKIVSIRKGNRRTNGQFIYYRQSGEAERKIRELINSARKSVFIVDPYYSPQSAMLFLAATRSSDVKTTILCTAGGLKRRNDGTDPGNELLSLIQTADKNLYGIVEVLVCPQVMLHDRFIVIDKSEVWLLGSSLNTLGDSLSVIVRLDNPNASIIHVLDTIVNDPQTCKLDKWIAKRDESQQQSVSEPCCP